MTEEKSVVTMACNKILNLIILMSFVNCVFSQNEVPVVETRFGPVRGVYEEDVHGQYNMYMGIPYAKLPEGNLFGASLDPDPWNDVLEANSDRYMCPQREEIYFEIVGDIDCLYLNVYVPANRTTIEPLSVLFWIQGGGFNRGYARRYMWGPEFLIRHDIIMVNVNFRLGPYGFTCLGTKEVPGNAVLKDLLKALRWVKENIEAFGGNPDDITAGGNSSGAIVIESLMTSPTNTEIFHRGIFQAGSSFLSEEISDRSSHEDILRLASYLGHRGGSIIGSIQFLQHIEPKDIVLAVELSRGSFTRCIEPVFDGVEAFFTDGSIKAIINGNFTSVDMLIGFNEVENPYRLEITEQNVNALLNSAVSKLSFDSGEDKNVVAEIIRRFYLGSKSISDDLKDELTDLNGDYLFIHPTLLSLKYLQRNHTAYLYEFRYDGGRNFNKYKSNITWVGAMHADEIGYLFNQSIYGEIDESDAHIVDVMTTMWSNFVKYGNPTPAITDLLPVQWLPYESGRQNYLKIDTVLSQAFDPNRERMAFWDLLMQAYFLPSIQR